MSSWLIIEALEPRRLFSAGDFDPNFGVAGTATIPFSATDFPQLPENFTLKAISVAADGDGTAVLGEATNPADGTSSPSTRVVLARLDASGGLESTFGVGGRLASSAFTNPADLLVQPDGKLLVLCGSVGVNNFAPNEVVRFDSDGTLDTSFGGGDGIAALPGQAVGYLKIAFDSTGRIVAAGVSDEDGIVARLTPDGVLDTTFGSSGSTIVPLNDGNTSFAALVQPNDQVVLAAVNDPLISDPVPHVTLAQRLNVDGTVDDSFHFQITGSDQSDVGVATDLNGNLIVITDAKESVSPLQVDATGVIVHKFSRIPAGLGDTLINDAAFDSQGRLLVTGNFDGVSDSATSLANFPYVARYTADGESDKTFGDSGLEQTPGNTFDLQADGNIVVAGKDGSNLVVSRLQSAAADQTPPADSISLTVRPTLPIKLVAGAALPARSKLQVAITNTTAATFSQRATITTYISSDATVDDADVAVSTTTAKLRLKSGQSKTITVKVHSLPRLAATGDYQLLAQATDESGAVIASAAAPRSLLIAGSFPNLAFQVKSVPPDTIASGGRVKIDTLLNNTGNTDLFGTGALTVTLVSLDGGTDQTAVKTLAVHLPRHPMDSRSIRFMVTVPSGLAPGSYELAGTLSGSAVTGVDQTDLTVDLSDFDVT